MGSVLLDEEKTVSEYINVELNEIFTYDDFFQFGQWDEYKYFSAGKMTTQHLYETSHKNENLMFNIIALLDQTGW